ncbi:MAG: hypothetical protein Q9191_007107, partial [Dirinaria sp. TL-2023a]
MASELPSNISPPPTFEQPQDSPQLTSLLHLNPQETPTASPPPPPQPQPQINHLALTLALFGWQAETDHIPGLATCNACFRRLGLWLFRPTLSLSSPSSSPKEPAMSRLDVIGEHRHYCPWINAESQNGPSRPRSSASDSLSATAASLHERAGWEILARWVANALRPRSAESQSRSEPRSDTPPASTLQGDGDAESVVDSVVAPSSTAVDAAST